MSTAPDSLNSYAVSVLEALPGCLDAIEAELKRLGWWSDDPPDLQAEVAAGRLKSWLDAPSFEIWLQCLFLPNARARVAERDLPEGSSVAEMARREYAYHSDVPEADQLLRLLGTFDGLIGAWNYHTRDRAEAEEEAGPLAAPEVEESPPVERRRLTPVEGAILDFENTLHSKRRELMEALAGVETAVAGLWEDGAHKDDATLAWLAGDFLTHVRAWLSRGQMPQESRVAQTAEADWRARGVLPERMDVLAKLADFDAKVAAWHPLSRRVESDSAHGRMLAAWRCIMAPTPVMESLMGREPDAVRTGMLLAMNRIEAELRLTGWWSEEAPVLPPECAGTIDYSAGHRDREALPPYAHWLQGALLPVLRARVLAGDIPKVQRMRDDANRALSEERLGAARFQETRPLYRAVDELETLIERAWPAALQKHGETQRLRGLTPPASAAAERAAAEFSRFRSNVAEAAQQAGAALKAPLWWTANSFQHPAAFEQWLRDVFLPDVSARLADGRPLEERRVSDYAARECSLLGLTGPAQGLLTALEKVDHWSHLANRALRDMWPG